MRQNGAVHRALVDEIHVLARQIIESVQIHRLLANDNLFPACLNIEHRLKHGAGTVLDKLSHGVQVGGQIHACREDTFLILALGLAVKLFPPLGNIVCAGLVVRQNLNHFALSQQDIAQRRVFHSIVLLERSFQRHLPAFRRAFHQFVDIRAGHRNGKQTYRRQYGKTSAHIVGHHKALVAFLIRQILKGSSCLVGSGVNSLRRTFLAVFLLCHFFEYAERDCRFRSRAGLGDHVDGEILVPDHVDQVLNISRTDGITYKINFGCFSDRLVHHIVEAVAQKLDRRARAQIGTADTDYHKHFGIALNFLRRFLDPRKLLLVIVHRQIDPSKEIIARTRLAHKYLFCVKRQLLHGLHFVLPNKGCCF